MIGEHTIPEDDRLLFLQCIMAAQDVFYASYTCMDVQSGTTLEPSTVVLELIDFVRAVHLASKRGEHTRRRGQRRGQRRKRDRIPTKPYHAPSTDATLSACATLDQQTTPQQGLLRSLKNGATQLWNLPKSAEKISRLKSDTTRYR